MADRKKDPKRVVLKLWNGGERANASSMAAEAKLTKKDLPDGMVAYRKRLQK